MKKKNVKTLKSTCDDSMFMSSEIVLVYKKRNPLCIVSMELETQSGSRLVYLREDEIQDLISNLQSLLELVKSDNNHDT